ncbi:MAG: hypothetical protein ACYDB5_10715 [bacterium]
MSLYSFSDLLDNNYLENIIEYYDNLYDEGGINKNTEKNNLYEIEDIFGNTIISWLDFRVCGWDESIESYF